MGGVTLLGPWAERCTLLVVSKFQRYFQFSNTSIYNSFLISGNENIIIAQWSSDTTRSLPLSFSVSDDHCTIMINIRWDIYHNSAVIIIVDFDKYPLSHYQKIPSSTSDWKVHTLIGRIFPCSILKNDVLHRFETQQAICKHLEDKKERCTLLEVSKFQWYFQFSKISIYNTLLASGM